MSIAQFIDHTVLKPVTTTNEIQKICAEALQYGFAAVCVPPVYVAAAKGFLKDDTVKAATVIGFPFGYTYTSAKEEEVKRAIAHGADELDMVHNLAALKNGDWTYLQKEIEAIATITQREAKTLKIIIESGLLTDEEIIKCCQIYKAYPVQFLKTSTGYAEKGATLESVQLMRRHLPSSIQIKASGGIKSYDFAKSLVDAGAIRLGCSVSVAIVNGAPVADAGY